MISALHSVLWPVADRAVPATTGPDRKSRPSPVFIHDAVVPWRGHTLLCEMLRHDLEDRDAAFGGQD